MIKNFGNSSIGGGLKITYDDTNFMDKKENTKKPINIPNQYQIDQIEKLKQV